MDLLLKRFKRNERFFFESVGVPGGSFGLGKGNPGWVPSEKIKTIVTNLPPLSLPLIDDYLIIGTDGCSLV